MIEKQREGGRRGKRAERTEASKPGTLWRTRVKSESMSDTLPPPPHRSAQTGRKRCLVFISSVFFLQSDSPATSSNCPCSRLSGPYSARRRADAANWPGAAGPRHPPMPPAESRAVLPAPPSPPRGHPSRIDTPRRHPPFPLAAPMTWGPRGRLRYHRG